MPGRREQFEERIEIEIAPAVLAQEPDEEKERQDQKEHARIVIPADPREFDHVGRKRDQERRGETGEATEEFPREEVGCHDQKSAGDQ